MKKLIIFLLISAFAFINQQFAQGYDQQKVQIIFDTNFSKIARNSKVNNEVDGSQYLYDDWKKIRVNLKDDSAEFEMGKFNLLNTWIEVLHKGEEKFIEKKFIISAEIIEDDKERSFFPAHLFSVNGTPLTGFMEFLSSDLPTVMIHHHTFIRKPNPTGNITGQSTVPKLFSSEKTYIYDGKELIPVKNKKSIRHLYPIDKINKVSKELKSNFKNPDEIQNLIDVLESRETGNTN
jgi:hypothetical protein